MSLRLPIQTSFAHLLQQPHQSLVHALLLGSVFTALSAHFLPLTHSVPNVTWHFGGLFTEQLFSTAMRGQPVY